MAIAKDKHLDVAPTEVSPKASRRRFTAEYKRRILREADACRGSGEVGALLRREGLYSSHLTSWRQARERGELEALTPKKRGRRARKIDAPDARVAELERENANLRAKLRKTEVMLDLQKKVAEILGTASLENSEVR